MRRPAAGVAAAVLVLACAPAARLRPAPRPPPIPLSTSGGHEELAVAGVVHVVRKGETVYRIARAYGIDPRDLMETNGIADPRAVAVGTELFIPGATAVVAVAPAGQPQPPASQSPSPSQSQSHSQSEPQSRSHSPTPDDGAYAEPPRDAPPSGAPAPAVAVARQEGSRLAWPLRGVLYGRFGMRAGQRHDGIDIAAPEGAIVGAAADGSVLYTGEQAGYGQIVILRHDDGLVTLYAHTSAVLVGEGAHVRRGQPIARVGQTGRTTGPHLHFEVRDGTRPRNPLLFLP